MSRTNMLAGANFCTSTSGWAAGTTTTTSVANNTTYCINGKAYTKTAASNAASATTDYATGLAFKPVPANHGSVFVAALDSSGNVKIIQGEVTATDPVTGAFITRPEFPIIPNNVTAIGYTTIKCSAAYVATTTGWLWGVHNMSSVTGVTYTFVSCLVLPDRPQA